MNHDEIDENNWRDKKDECLPYVKKDVLCTAYSYARYSQAMEEITEFSMKDCLSFSGLGWKYFNGLRTEEDEPIYTYNDKHMRWFVRQSVKGGRVCVFNQYYNSEVCADFLKIISEELIVKGNIYDFIETYLNYKNKHFKISEKNMKINLMIIEMKMEKKNKFISMKN